MPKVVVVGTMGFSFRFVCRKIEEIFLKEVKKKVLQFSFKKLTNLSRSSLTGLRSRWIRRIWGLTGQETGRRDSSDPLPASPLPHPRRPSLMSQSWQRHVRSLAYGQRRLRTTGCCHLYQEMGICALLPNLGAKCHEFDSQHRSAEKPEFWHCFLCKSCMFCSKPTLCQSSHC